MSTRTAYANGPSTIETYSEVAVQHFMSPCNTARIEGVNGKGCTSSESLDDLLQISIRVGPSDRIDAVRFRTVGCAAAVACGSKFSEMVEGLSLTEASHITPEDIVQALGGLPRSKAHYARLPVVALQAAIEDHHARARVARGRRLRNSFVYRRASGPVQAQAQAQAC